MERHREGCAAVEGQSVWYFSIHVLCDWAYNLTSLCMRASGWRNPWVWGRLVAPLYQNVQLLCAREPVSFYPVGLH